MVTEILVKEPLEKEMIDGGRELLQRLTKSGFKVTTALWLWNRERPSWQLLIASPLAKKNLREAYQKLGAALREKPPFPNWQLTPIQPLTNAEPRIKALRAEAKKYHTDMAGERLKGSWLNTVAFDDAYIYFVK